MDTIRKFLDFNIKVVNDKERTLHAIASTGDRDRDGDILDPNGWKLANFRKNPVILWAHNHRELPIGKALDVGVKDEKLEFTVQFTDEEMNPKGQQVFNMFKAGFLRTFSVGFLPYKIEPLTEEDKKNNPRPGMMNDFGRRFKSELLEISGVPVPSNPQALAQKAFGDLMLPALELRTEAKTLGEDEMKEILPHHHNDGSVYEDGVRAAMAIILGARGGINLPEEKKLEAYKHLAAHYEGRLPDFLPRLDVDLKEMFSDIWETDILDLSTKALELPPIKIDWNGIVKKEQVEKWLKARDALNVLIEQGESDPQGNETPHPETAANEAEGEARAQKAMDSIANDLKEIGKKL